MEKEMVPAKELDNTNPPPFKEKEYFCIKLRLFLIMWLSNPYIRDILMRTNEGTKAMSFARLWVYELQLPWG